MCNCFVIRYVSVINYNKLLSYAQRQFWKLSFYLFVEAFKTYFKSSRASHIQSAKGTQKAHVAKCRRRNRKDEVCNLYL